MSVLGKLSGAQSSGNAIYARVGGVQTIVQEGFVKVDGAYVSFHKNVIEKLLTSTTNAVMQDLFTVDEWASTTPKLVTIPAGQVIGSNDNTIEALRTGTGGGGLITLNVLGEIQGAGGPAGSGVGGDAFNAEQAVALINDGAIRAGGGGGGLGGTGGQGSYSVSNSQSGGRSYSGTTIYTGFLDKGAWKQYYWSSSYKGQNSSTSLSHGGYVYSKNSSGGGNSLSDDNGNYFGSVYNINRTWNTTSYSSGGTGGNGGRGLGYDAAAAGGSGGSAGGTNAGTGGTGGTGATWGATGATGSTGVSGNYTGGSSGSGGGAAGNALLGIGNVTLTNNGTIQGIQA